MKIALTNIYVDDPIKAFRFYTEILGFLNRIFLPECDLAIVASPQDPKGPGLLLEPNTNPIAKSYQEALYNAGSPAIIFGVEDIYEEYLRLKNLGIVFRSAPTQTEWGIQTLFEDTCGNLIHMHQIG